MSRIGSVGYLNARPLTSHIDIDKHTVILAHPAEVARMLRDREVDVALVPVGAVLGVPGLKVVPGVCVGSAGPVTSVVLAAETPPEQWTKVVLDGVSRTSVVLAELLLRHGPLKDRVRPDLEIVHAAPGAALPQAKRTVAALVIGDAARDLPAKLSVRLDLASEWREWTGLPFVFAVWAGRADLDPRVVEHLESAGRRGMDAVPTSYSGADLHYLTASIRHTLDDAALTGLRRFAALAHRAGLVPGEEFELFGPAPRRLRPDTDLLLARALDGGALPPGEILALLRYAPIADLCAAAELRRREAFPGDEVPWRMVAALPADAPIDSVRPAIDAGATRIVLTGPVRAERVAEVRAAYPSLELQAGTAQDDEPSKLAAAGISWLAEEKAGTLSDRLRTLLAEVPSSAWLAWVERAHRAGLKLPGTLAVGQGESEEELVAHLLRLRDLPALVSVRVWAADGAGPFGTMANTASDHLRATALARLVLPGHIRLVASFATEGWGVAQCSLRAGCDEVGELIVTGDPAHDAPRIAELEHQVKEVGLVPVREALPRPRPVKGSPRNMLAV
jgi:predicted solute-binding protein